MSKKVCVVGHYGNGKEFYDGQTVKTKIITKELIRQLGAKEVLKIDTYGGKRNLPKLFLKTRKAMSICRNIVIMPATNGLRFFAPVVCFWNKIYKKKIHYIVIGGWLADFIKDKRMLKRCLMKFDGIYVETNTMKNSLESMGFRNIYVLPNCKELNILKEGELIYSFTEPLSLCTFSRVMKEKGIEDIIRAVEEVNKRYGADKFSLDIYGQVDENYRDCFETIIKNAPHYIRYCGIISYDKSTEVLKKYFALVFPTRFYTEGIPGTIIDAYASGVPVISAKWESFDDLVIDGEVGYGYHFNDYAGLVNTLIHVADQPDCLIKMRSNCIKKAQDYTAAKVVEKFVGGGTNQIISSPQEPLKLCTFSRVMKEKGIETAVSAVEAINEKLGKTAFLLDIYGQVEPSQEIWFSGLQRKFPGYISYKGMVEFDKSVDVLKKYTALLFPTYYAGEGFAGTLIDAMAAGVPVIASDWKYNAEIVRENETGVIIRDGESLEEKLLWLLNNIGFWNAMKRNSVEEAQNYLPARALDVFMKRLT